MQARARARRLAVTWCPVAFLLSTAAIAQQLPPVTATEQVLQVNEPPNVRSVLRLGAAVAVSGDTLLTAGGSSVYVFSRSTAGGWTQSAKLVASDQGTLTGPIAFDGTHALIRGYSPQDVSVVYSYLFDGSRWRAQGVLKGAASFGMAIAMDGCGALITSGYEEGARAISQPPRLSFVHYFDRCRTPGRWTWVNSIGVPNRGGMHWGISLALSGNNAYIGAPEGETDGAVYHYVRSADDTWRRAQVIVQTGPDIQRGFGTAVAQRDNLLLVGVNHINLVEPFPGLVLQFGRSANQWVQLGKIEVDAYEPTEAVGYKDFGRRILITATHVIIGAPAIDDPRPAVWVYSRSGPTDVAYPGERIDSIDRSIPWNPQDKFTTFGRTHFGEAIAVSGSTLVVGAPRHSPLEKPALVQGRTAVYDLSVN